MCELLNFEILHRLVNRELQPWIPDKDEAKMEGLSSAAGANQPGGGKWDQFEVNQRQFGVETTFDEDLYTTKLDRNNAGISEKDAARIAKEIEGRKTNNPHLAEERGQIAYREMVSSFSPLVVKYGGEEGEWRGRLT
jgi:PAB1-binding protein PBP1